MWLAVPNQTVIGCVFAMIDKQMEISVKCIGKFSMLERLTPTDICQTLSNVKQNPLSDWFPDYFVSDFALTKIAAFRKYVVNGYGDDYWFQCAVDFLQLSIEESVRMFLEGSSNQAYEYGDDTYVEWDELNGNGVLDASFRFNLRIHSQDLDWHCVLKARRVEVLVLAR